MASCTVHLLTVYVVLVYIEWCIICQRVYFRYTPSLNHPNITIMFLDGVVCYLIDNYIELETIN